MQFLFLAHLYKRKGSYCCQSDDGICCPQTLKFNDKFFYVIDKELFGKLSCMQTGPFIDISAPVVSKLHVLISQSKSSGINFEIWTVDCTCFWLVAIETIMLLVS